MNINDVNLVATKTSISFNNLSFTIKFNPPEAFPQNGNNWSFMWSPNYQVAYLDIFGESTQSIEIEKTEENYQKYCQPLIDLWQVEYDRVQVEQEAAKQELLKYENRKERALNEIQKDYEAVLERGFVRTSLGFDADISPDSSATLLGTQTSLVYTMRTLAESETPKTVFRDFYGLKRELDAVQVERLICEINGAQNHIRELKYAFKGAVKETFDNDSLNACIENCVYSTLDYSNLDESSNPAILPFVEVKSIKERIDAI